MDYPTEEELAELNELQYGGGGATLTGGASQQAHSQSSQNIPSSGNSFFQNSPQLSQIQQETRPIHAVNKRLFDTTKTSSTPIALNHRRAPIESPSLEGLSQIPFLGEPETNLRKRRLDQLFGDITDIQDDDFNYMDLGLPYEAKKKKTRTEEEIDVELIEKILQIRAENETKSSNPLRYNRLEHIEKLRKFKAQNISETYPKWPCTPVVNTNKDRLYVRMHSEDFEQKQLEEISFKKNYGNLLGESSKDIWDQAQQIVQKRMLNSIAEEPAILTEEAIVTDPMALPSTEKLWVEKYRPKSYLDLLSDESTNRSLLTWLKMWDKAVFKREFKLVKDDKQGPTNFFNKRTGKFEMGFRKKSKKNDLQNDIDEHGRPVQRVAVLCGPPGLGKTTLAHTIAQHAGYAVREMNASDDRSLDAFQLALQNGTQMQTNVLNPDRRPNCIILDEIDGAPAPSIEYLVRFINEQTKETTPGGGGAKKGGKKTQGILRRPIICICNDIFTPSLRSLRQMAFIVTFPPLESTRLAERLLSIARKERLKTDLTTLIALSEKSGNDIRSCISVLQFYANSRKPLTISDVIKSNIGLKDKQRGLFDIWNAVFQIRRPRLKLESRPEDRDSAHNDEICAIGETSLRARMETVLDVVHSGGDYERLASGVYENYLGQKMPDPNMVGVSEATDWFCFSDQLNSQIQHKQNYTIYPYLQFGFVIWHLLFSTPRLPKIKFPVQGYEHSQKVGLQKTIRSAFLKKLSAGVRCLGSGPSILLDTVTFVRHILSPNLRFVSLQLLTTKEKCDLRHTVEVMADLGLSYTQMRVADGTYQYQLEPDINILCHFAVSTNYTPLTYFNMQLIAREVEVEVMRRAMPKQATITENGERPKQKKAPPKFDIHKQILKPRAIDSKKKADAVTKDFFGRVTVKPPITASQQRAEDVKSRVWYHFKEGFNNAVRKDITMSKLL